MRREVGDRGGRVMGMYCVYVCVWDRSRGTKAGRRIRCSILFAPNVRTNNVSQVKALMKRYTFLYRPKILHPVWEEKV